MKTRNASTLCDHGVSISLARYDRQTGVAVVMRDGINGPVHTAFQQPAAKWNPNPYGSGR